MSRLLTIPQAAKRLQVSPDHVWRLVRAERITVVRLGRSVRIDPPDLDAYIASAKTRGSRPAAAIDVFAPNPGYRPPAA